MRLEGSCHCGAVRFALNAEAPVPYMRCYCSICRKTAGGGGYAINLGGSAASLEVTGEEHLSVYRAKTRSHGEPSQARRHFCKRCGSTVYWEIAPIAKTIGTVVYGVAVGCFDDPEFPEPRWDLFKAYQHGWVGELDSAECALKLPDLQRLTPGPRA